MQMNHKGVKLRQWGGEGKRGMLKFSKPSFLWFALPFASFLSLGIFFHFIHIHIISQRNKTQWRNLPSLPRAIQINVYIMLQTCKVLFMLGSVLSAEISNTVIEPVFITEERMSNNYKKQLKMLLLIKAFK